MTLDTTVFDTISAWQGDLKAIRRDIHRNPEMGFEEHRTAAKVAALLRSWGIDVEEGIGKTGVVGTLRGNKPGKRSIALRADMDALAIHEGTGLPHASGNPGVMHACGHDGHTTMLLAAARYLAKSPNFQGTVHFIFQPAEEGLGGARAMIEDGLFERFPCEAIHGMHVEPKMAAGTFATRAGPVLASSDTWTVTFKGSGGHGGANVHLSTDPTVPAANFVLAMQTIVSRSVNSFESAVISVGHIAAGQFASPNVIPNEVLIRGTARCFAPEVRDVIETRLGEIASSSAQLSRCTASVDYLRRYPVLMANADATARSSTAAVQLVGEDKVSALPNPISASEDFAFFAEQRPGSFMFIGNAGEGNSSSSAGVHTPLFDFNDDIIPLGASYWVALVGIELGAAGDAQLAPIEQ